MTRLSVLALSLPVGIPILVLASVFLPKLAGTAVAVQLTVLAPWLKKIWIFLGKAMKGGGKLAAAPVLLVIAIISVPSRRFTDAFARTLLPTITAAYGFGTSRSAASLSRLRHAAAAALPYKSVSRVTVDPKLLFHDDSGRSDLLACNVVAYQRTWGNILFNKGRESQVFNGIAAVVRMPARTSVDVAAVRPSAPGNWDGLRVPMRENGTTGLPNGWKRFGGSSLASDLPCLDMVGAVAGICETRCDRQSTLVVRASDDTLVVLADTRDRLLACLRPERYGGTTSMIATIKQDLEAMREIADAVAASRQEAPVETTRAS